MPRLSEDQQLLAESAAEVLGAEAGPARFRALRDAGERTDMALWSQLTELGWPAIPFTEAHGGMGWGLPELAVVMEALGHHLAMTPMLSTVLTGTLAPELGGASGQVAALAWQEGDRECGIAIAECQATVSGGKLTGTKRRVLDAGAADALVVLALDASTPALFLADAADAALSPLIRMDHRDCADVHFTDAPVRPVAASTEDLQTALDQATIALSAEMLGGAQAALNTTTAYLKEREQFGVPIGSFQALQHRIVDCYIALELARSAVHSAARSPTPELISLAKTQCNEAYFQIANEAVQMHGGIGMTDEHDIGFHMKRARVMAQTLGTSAQHRDRWARLRGY
jgi:alkylation response protein AidB-like acyl-CoA dehydrogenase